MIEQERQGGAPPPHGIIIAVVVAVIVLLPFLVGDNGEAITAAIADLLTPIGLLLLPIILLLTIQYLSTSDSTTGSFISAVFSSGEPNSIHRASGSTAGVAILLLLVLFLLYNRFYIFGGDGESGD
ncbi:uncharacterized protein [Rutidosis leptorrhynchoides]|uniref:uncharacterized protein n=1 Tax=Rutidosis leptorrhynchoides TaxID=125765 RepID=UPI003A99C2AE